MTDGSHFARATFSGGWFWCLQPPFDALDGVVATVVGYAGGCKTDPVHEDVAAGRTGHALAVQVLYDSGRIDYSQLLDVFWRNIDPTLPNRQFCVTGAQYRTAIFYHDETQKHLAEGSVRNLSQILLPVFRGISGSLSIKDLQMSIFGPKGIREKSHTLPGRGVETGSGRLAAFRQTYRHQDLSPGHVLQGRGMPSALLSHACTTL